jgi:GntR family transcriptional regulator
MRRLRLADDEPMAIEISYLLPDFYKTLRTENPAERSLYEILKEHCHTIPTRAVQEMEACPCPGQEAQLLCVRKGSPVLHIHRTTHDQNDRPFEQVESFYRGDRYIFYAELTN